MAPLAVSLGAAVGVTSLDGGGFTVVSQSLLIGLAGATLLIAGQASTRVLLAVSRTPLVLVLLALGALSVLSAAWTIASATVAARWGLVIVAYGVLAACGAVVAVRFGAWPIAVGIAVLAAIEAVLGLRAAALHALPDAERIAGTWRPGGSFQYPPALGLLEVMALPPLISSLDRSRGLAPIAAIGAALAGLTIGSAHSRLDLGLAVAVLALAVAHPSAGRRPRAEPIASAGLIVVAMIAGRLVIASDAAGGVRLALIAGVCVVLAFAWLPTRSVLRARPRMSGYGARAAVVLAAGAAAVAIGSSGGSLTHGRIDEWRAAVETWLDRPVAGSGAGSYYAASATHQGATLFAHDLPLELAAELGALGLILGVGVYVASFQALRQARGSPALWLLGPAVIAFLVANLVDWPWHLAGLGAAWAACAGGLVAARRGRRPLPLPAGGT